MVDIVEIGIDRKITPSTQTENPIHIRLIQSRGRYFVDARRFTHFFEIGKDVPTRSGIMIPISSVREVIDALQGALMEFDNRGTYLGKTGGR